MKIRRFINTWVYLLIIGTNIHAQRIGIGTSTPQATLDIVKSFRVGGVMSGSSWLAYDSLTGIFNWNNASLFAPASQALIKHSTNAEGLYYDNGQLEYRNQFNALQFRTHWPSGNAFIGGMLGIGRPDPASPVHFYSLLGEKVIFWGDANTNYGIGVQPSQLQFHTDGFYSDILFGYGSSSNFSENMRITGYGNLGIGTNSPQAKVEVRKGNGNSTATFFSSNPSNNSHFNYSSAENTYLRGSVATLNDIPGGKVGIGIEPFITDGVLEVAGRLQIHNATRNTFTYRSAIWFNKVDNSGLAGTLEMYDDNHIAFSGGPWLLKMNTQTGAFDLGGSDGDAGDVFQSGGPGAAARWRSPSKSIYDLFQTNKLNTSYYVVSGTPPILVPGMSYSVTVPTGGATILFSYNISALADGHTGTLLIDIMYDGVLQTRSAYNDPSSVTGSRLIQANAGNHTISIMASSFGGNVNLNVSGLRAGGFIQIMPK